MEKLMNSWFYKFCEKLYVMIILNLISFIMIVLGLGFFTTLPVLVSLILVLKDYRSNESFPFLKAFFKCFKYNYKRLLKLSIPYLLCLFVFIFNTYYFYSWTNESSNLYYSIAYYVCLVVDVLIALSFINCGFIFVYFPHLSDKKILKYSVTLISVIMLQAILILIIFIGFLYLGVVFVPLLPTILISLFIVLVNELIRNTYLRITPKNVRAMSVYDYLNETS